MFPFSRSLEVTSVLTDEIRISFRETNLLGVATDRSASIIRQQVQHILSFSLRSQAKRSLRSAPDYFSEKTERVQRALWSFWFTYQAVLPLFVLQAAISPVRFSMLKASFSLKEHSRLHFHKDNVVSCYRQRITCAFLDSVVTWHRVMVTIAASCAQALSMLRWRL